MASAGAVSARQGQGGLPTLLATLRRLASHLIASYHWAWMDVRCRYRRSVIGPFWETINVLVLILGMSYISSTVFGTDQAGNMLYVGLGIIIWTAVSGVVVEGTTCFMFNKELIKNSTLGIAVYVGRSVFRIFITTGHHFLLYFLALLVLPVPVSWVNLLSLVGIGFLLLNAFWVMACMGLICARFRDVEMVVRNLMQLVFFVTPIFWNYRNISSERRFLLEYNPIFYFLNTIRAPLLGEVPVWQHYAALCIITVLGYALLWVLYRSMRRYLAFYV